MRLIGFDPGLRHTGWGVIESDGNRLSHVANGAVTTDPKGDLASRLVELYDGLVKIIGQFAPLEAAVEETFVNKNPTSTLKLGQARGVVLLVPARAGLVVSEYTPNLIKKSVVGAGHAAKEQVQMMVGVLLPGTQITSADAADALAVAICHAHHRASAAAMAKVAGGIG
ncbi:MAG: crossover junction endodeoxyribonuclease RuvC [Alphaproteobacteria bacterium]|nr:crossover junction endodeoxyribonuclease RuvC [Alphaproteobacteria bacterium]MBL6932023.1 crossover junction endodeoxyribonuclease RuvC [Rhodospirillales bacterium]